MRKELLEMHRNFSNKFSLGGSAIVFSVIIGFNYN